MIKKFAWDVFEKTGNINTFMEFRKIEELEKGIGINNELENMENEKKWQT